MNNYNKRGWREENFIADTDRKQKFSLFYIHNSGFCLFEFFDKKCIFLVWRLLAPVIKSSFLSKLSQANSSQCLLGTTSIYQHQLLSHLFNIISICYFLYFKLTCNFDEQKHQSGTWFQRWCQSAETNFDVRCSAYFGKNLQEYRRHYASARLGSRGAFSLFCPVQNEMARSRLWHSSAE